MKLSIKLTLLLFFVASFSMLNAENYNIKDFGAVADGKTLNTKAIQKAIDACAQNGGGQVVIPSGIFMSGTIKLKDNVAIYLEPSAVLLGSPEYEDYEWEPYGVKGGSKRRSLIHGRELKNVAVLGRGTVDGNGGHKNFQGKSPFNGIDGGLRPFPISIANSTNVKIQDITIKDGAFWDMKIDVCNNVFIDGVTVRSRIVANNDGMDIVDCSNVVIANCDVDAGDDGICLKSNTTIGVKNVTITNCIIKSESNAIKLGVASRGGFENITISNCALYDTRLSGIALEMVEGGIMDRIAISNITMHNVNGSIFMKSGRKKGYSPTIFRNVIVSNVVADGIGCWRPDTSVYYHKKEHDQRIGITITGQADCIVENVTLSDIHLQFAGGGTAADAKRPFKDSKADGYPEYNNFGITPAYGINCQYVKNIRFNNVVLDYIEKDVRPAMFFQESENVTLNAIYAKVSDETKAYVRFINQQGAFILNCKPVSGKAPFCSFEENAKNITIQNNDFSSIKGAYVKSEEISVKSIKMINNQ